MDKLQDFENLKPGDLHYKAFVGPPEKYDLVGAMQFNILTGLGLRDFNKVLDIGCGSLRLGKLLIPFLSKNNYYGIEPNQWLVEEGIQEELGKEIISIKSPVFKNSDQFELQEFNKRFDFIIAQSIFSHASQDQIKKCLSEVALTLKNEGIFIATFILDNKDYEGNEWVYPECVKFTKQTITRLINQAGLKYFSTNWDHPNRQTWYMIFHQGYSRKAKGLLKNAPILSKEKPFSRWTRYFLF